MIHFRYVIYIFGNWLNSIEYIRRCSTQLHSVWIQPSSGVLPLLALHWIYSAKYFSFCNYFLVIFYVCEILRVLKPTIEMHFTEIVPKIKVVKMTICNFCLRNDFKKTRNVSIISFSKIKFQSYMYAYVYIYT